MEPVSQTVVSHERVKKELRVLLMNRNLIQQKFQIEQNKDATIHPSPGNNSTSASTQLHKAKIECGLDRSLDFENTKCSKSLCDAIKCEELDIKFEEDNDNMHLRMEENINEESNCIYHRNPKNCVISCQQEYVDFYLGKSSYQKSGNTKSKRNKVRKQFCQYCMKEVNHFARHLRRHHRKEEAVKSIMKFSKGDPRRKLLFSSLRKQGNYLLSKKDSVVRPVKNTVKKSAKIKDNKKPTHVPCVYCLGYYSRTYLARHVQICELRKLDDDQKKPATTQKISHLSQSQIFELSTGKLKTFYASLELTKVVFPVMHNDNISRVAMGDVVICCFGDAQLRKMKRTKSKMKAKTVISNRIRSMSRLLIALRKNCDKECLFDILTSNHFLNIVEATEEVCKYDKEEKKFRLVGLAVSIRSYLKFICEMVSNLVSKNFQFLPCENIDQRLKDLRQLQILILKWKIFYSDSSLRSSIEVNSLLTLTSDVMLMNYLVRKEANCCYDELNKKTDNQELFVELQRCCFVLLATLNRFKVNRLQEIDLENYLQHCYTITSADIQENLPEVEKILLKNYKRIPDLNTDEQQEHVLISADLQKYIALLVQVRSNFTKSVNPFLFITIDTVTCLDGITAINTMDENLELNCSQALSDPELRKFVSLVTQIQSLKDDAFEQLCALLELKDTQTTIQKNSKEPRCIADLVKRILSAQKTKADDHTNNETLISLKTVIKESQDSVLNYCNKNNDPETPQMDQLWVVEAIPTNESVCCTKDSMCNEGIGLMAIEGTSSDMEGNKKRSEEKGIAIESEMNIKIEEKSDVEDSGLEDSMNEDDDSDNQEKPTDGLISSEQRDLKPDLSELKDLDNNNKKRTKPKYKRPKQFCHFCKGHVLNYVRHLNRRHRREETVKTLVTLPRNDPKRKVILANLHRQANNMLRRKNIRKFSAGTLAVQKDNYKPTHVVCNYCMGNFKRNYLQRHAKKCRLRSREVATSQNKSEKTMYLSEAQIFEICTGKKMFYKSLEIFKEVFPIMCNDYVSKVAMGDVVICCFGDRQWRNMKKQKRKNLVSTKMRDVARLLIALRSSCELTNFFDFLTPKCFDKIVETTEAICEYDAEKQAFNKPSLALHMRSHLKNVCDMVIELLSEHYKFLPCDNIEQRVEELDELKSLIREWRIPHISPSTLKAKLECDENLLELTSNILQINDLVRKEANICFEEVKKDRHNPDMFLKLQRCCFVLLATLNGHDVTKLPEIDYGKYMHNSHTVSYEDTRKNLSDVGKILLGTHKKVSDLFKAEQQEPVLFSEDLQTYLTYLIALRSNFLNGSPSSNPYLFITINDESCLDGSSAVIKIAEELKLKCLDTLTDNKLKKYVSLVTQIQRLGADKFGQLCFLLGFADGHQDFTRFAEDPRWIADIANRILSQNKLAEYQDDVVSKIFVKNENKTLDDTHRSREQKPKKRITRERWSEEHKKLTEEYFRGHIERRKPPTQSDVEQFQELYPVLKSKHWEKIKAFVYNAYTKLKYRRDSDSTYSRTSLQEPEILIEETITSQDSRIDDKRHLLNINLNNSMNDQNDVSKASQNQSVDNKEDALDASENRSANDQEDLIEAGQNKSAPDWENEYKVFADQSDNKNFNKEIPETKKMKLSKERWSIEHRKLTKEYFKNHIRRKRAPTKTECEKFRELYPAIKGKDWLKIKAFVYNVYTKLNRTVEKTDDDDEDNKCTEEPNRVSGSARHPIKDEKIEKQIRETWSEEHKRITKTYFKDHIERKRAPTESECEAFKALYPELKNKHWIKIKVFVYNVYKNRYSK